MKIDVIAYNTKHRRWTRMPVATQREATQLKRILKKSPICQAVRQISPSPAVCDEKIERGD